jgi:alpha-ketoglutarate-dependent taurine dioxygenase
MTATPKPTIRRLTTAIGAEILGVDLRHPMSAETFGVLHRALLDHGAIFFANRRSRPISNSNLPRVGARFIFTRT